MMGDEKLSSTYLIRQKIEFLLSGSPVLNGGLGAKISPFDFNDTGWIKKITHGFLTKDKNFNKSSKTSQINLIFQHGVLYSSVAS